MKSELIIETFNLLDEHHINFLTLRNFDFIPNHCSVESDIDVLVKRQMMESVIKIMEALDYTYFIDNDPSIQYLYGAEPHHHFVNWDIGIHFDVVTGLYYRSLDEGQYVPVIGQLQDLIFERKLKTREIWCYQPAPEDELIHICCHAIFDKNEVSKRYAEKMSLLIDECDPETLLNGLHLVFYKFAPVLIQEIKKGEAHNLFDTYISFADY